MGRFAMPKTLRNAPIRTWEAGDNVQGFALLTKKETRQDRNGKSFLDLELADASGSIVAKIWADSPALNGRFETHQFVAFRGSVKNYRDQLQLTIDDCREATRGRPPLRLRRIAAHSVHPRGHRRSLEATRPASNGESRAAGPAPPRRRDPGHPRQGPARAPGGQGHAPRLPRRPPGARRSRWPSWPRWSAGHYRDLDRDLVLLGVLFHDLGKLRELGAMPANDYTLEGRLIGHVVIGRDLLIERCARDRRTSPTTCGMLLEHMVLSHQGKKEFASPVEPMTPEALALHFIDDLDSKINQLRASREANPGMQFHRGLGRYVYLPPLEERPRARSRPRRAARSGRDGKGDAAGGGGGAGGGGRGAEPAVRGGVGPAPLTRYPGFPPWANGTTPLGASYG